MKRRRPSCTELVCLATLLILALTGCGGGGSSSPPPAPEQNPVPVLNSVSPTAAATGGPAFTLTVNGASFISSSQVRWNGSARTTTFASSTRLTAAILASDIAADGTAQVTVFNPAPGGGTSAAATFTIAPASPVVIKTTQLPATSGGREYYFTLAAEGGLPPLAWSVSGGALPDGLSLGATSGRITGFADPVGADTQFDFTLQATDAAATPNVGTRALSITVLAAGNLGPNDACSAGTTVGTTRVSNGRIRASISPYGDVDVYSFNGTKDKQVTIEIFAQRLNLDGNTLTRDSQMDSMLELLSDSCPAPTLNGTSALAFNDDIVMGEMQDSLIPNFTLPYTGLYFIRVRDFRGDGRPDLIYELSLSGAD